MFQKQTGEGGRGAECVLLRQTPRMPSAGAGTGTRSNWQHSTAQGGAAARNRRGSAANGPSGASGPRRPSLGVGQLRCGRRSGQRAASRVVALQGAGGRARKKASARSRNSRFALQSYENRPGPFSRVRDRPRIHATSWPCGGARSCPPRPEGHIPPLDPSGCRTRPESQPRRCRSTERESGWFLSSTRRCSDAAMQRCRNPESHTLVQVKMAFTIRRGSIESRKRLHNRAILPPRLASWVLVPWRARGCVIAHRPPPFSSSTNCSCRLGNGTIARDAKPELFQVTELSHPVDGMAS